MRNSRTSSSGAAVRNSSRTKATASTTAAAAGASTLAESQPAVGPWITAYTSEPIARQLVTAPGTSSRAWSGSRLVGMVTAQQIASAPSAAVNAKIERYE